MAKVNVREAERAERGLIQRGQAIQLSMATTSVAAKQTICQAFCAASEGSSG